MHDGSRITRTTHGGYIPTPRGYARYTGAPDPRAQVQNQVRSSTGCTYQASGTMKALSPLGRGARVLAPEPHPEVVTRPEPPPSTPPKPRPAKAARMGRPKRLLEVLRAQVRQCNGYLPSTRTLAVLCGVKWTSNDVSATLANLESSRAIHILWRSGNRAKWSERGRYVIQLGGGDGPILRSDGAPP